MAVRKRITGYFVSVRDFDDYHRLEALAPVARHIGELDAATLRTLAASRMDQRHDILDALID